MSDPVRPAYRLMAAQIERSRQQAQLGNFSEVGAVWAPKEGKVWYPCAFNIVPSGLGHGYVRMFLAPASEEPIKSLAPAGRPMFRIMAAPVVDRGELGGFHSVGAVWPPKDETRKWAPFNLDLVPMGLDRGGVKLFLMPVTEAVEAVKAA